MVWLGHRLLADTDLITSTLAMAVLVVVPLGLSLISLNARQAKVFGWLSLLQPFAAFGALLALTLEPRGPTGLFAVPWCVLTLGAGVAGLFGLTARDSDQPLAHSLALLLLPAGGAWLCISRAGFDPLGNGVLIVLLTAVHFHFVAFAGLVVMGCNSERLSGLVRQGAAPARLARFGFGTTVALVAGYLLVALGIASIPLAGVVGAVLLSLALFVHALLHLLVVLRHQRGALVKLLLCISSTSVLMSMPLACAWAVGQWLDISYIDFSSMLRIHGMANAHGFVLAGLVGFWLDAKNRETQRAAEATAPAAATSSPDLVGSESP